MLPRTILVALLTLASQQQALGAPSALPGPDAGDSGVESEATNRLVEFVSDWRTIAGGLVTSG